MTVAQNAAETLKAVGADGGDMGAVLTEAAQHLGGTCEQGLLCVRYDADWNVVPSGSDGTYRLCAQGEPAAVENLWQARLWVEEESPMDGASQEPIFQLAVAWQEVGVHG